MHIWFYLPLIIQQIYLGNIMFISLFYTYLWIIKSSNHQFICI